MTYASRCIKSPVGTLQLIAGDKGLKAVLWGMLDIERIKLSDFQENNKHPVLLETERQLKAYFEGKLKTFQVPLDADGTDFQHKAWKALQSIPYGQTRSYGEQAKQIGKPKASRAVGAANGKNPLSIIVPCHRVIGASGKLTGFAGGLKIKAQLLELEKIYL